MPGVRALTRPRFLAAAALAGVAAGLIGIAMALLLELRLELVGVVVGQGRQAGRAHGYRGSRRIGLAQLAGPTERLQGAGPRDAMGVVGAVEGGLRGILTGTHTHSLS